MALWQYVFKVLTKESFDVLGKDMLYTSNENLFNDEPFWEFVPIHKSYFDDVGEILQKGSSWSKEIDLYGSLESHCFEVYFDSVTNNATSVSFRISFISNYENVLNRIIEFCLLKGLVILDEKLQVLTLNFESIRNSIENAPQVRKYNDLKGD